MVQKRKTTAAILLLLGQLTGCIHHAIELPGAAGLMEHERAEITNVNPQAFHAFVPRLRIVSVDGISGFQPSDGRTVLRMKPGTHEMRINVPAPEGSQSGPDSCKDTQVFTARIETRPGMFYHIWDDERDGILEVNAWKSPTKDGPFHQLHEDEFEAVPLNSDVRCNT